MSLQQDLILSLPHFALKQFLSDFVATVLEVSSASKYFDKCMEFAKIQVSFPCEWQLSRHNSSGNVVMAWLQLLSNLISKPASSRCLESFNNRHHPPFHISLSCPLSSLCLLYPWGKTWGSGKALNLCRDTSDNICQYTSDTQHILNYVFSADQIWQETLNIVGHLKPCHMFISSDHKNTFYLVQGSGWDKS